MTTQTAREMLKKIDEFLVEAPLMEVRALWNVLTALRGPDWALDPADPRKLATTGVIRQAALPRAAESGWTGAFFEEDSPAYVEIRRGLRTSEDHLSHFRSHARWAFEALGLKW